MFTIRTADSAGSVGIAAPVFLLTISVLGLLSPVVLAEGHVDPAPETIKGWLEVFAYLAGLILLVVNLVKAFRPDPSSDKKFATKTEMERVEKESKDRDATHKEELARSERASEAKHTENVRKIEEISGKLDRNHKEDHQERAKLRDDVRHDLRQEVQPLQTKIDEHTADVAKGFQSLAGEIGGLKVAKDASDAHASEVRRTLQILLSRTAPAGNRGGVSEL